MMCQMPVVGTALTANAPPRRDSRPLRAGRPRRRGGAAGRDAGGGPRAQHSDPDVTNLYPTTDVHARGFYLFFLRITIAFRYTGLLSTAPRGDMDSCRPVLVELAYCLEGENPSRPGGAEPLPLVFGAGAAPCAPCCPDSAVAPALSASGSSILSLRSPVGTCTWSGLGVRVRG